MFNTYWTNYRFRKIVPLSNCWREKGAVHGRSWFCWEVVKILDGVLLCYESMVGGKDTICVDFYKFINNFVQKYQFDLFILSAKVLKLSLSNIFVS